MSARVLSDAPWLSSGPAARALALLNADGEEARVVGGAVRNALMHRPICDVDIATTALPDEVMRRADTAGIKCVPTGVAHGTVTLVIEGQPFEITTLREDVETFGRKARVAFGRDWNADAQRRDFTINGLSVSADGVVHDHVGGLADIDARRVRFIGDPDQRIAEDYLRILRFFRIHASYGTGDPDRAGLLACIRGRAGMVGLSAERVRMELLKLLVSEGALAAVTSMADSGLLVQIFGGVAYLGPFAAMITAEAATAQKPDAVLRLGALGVAVVEDARRLAMRLRLTNGETRALESMADGWWRFAGLDEIEARRTLYRLGPTDFCRRVMFAWSRAGGNVDPEPWHELVTLPKRWDAPKFPLRAADFIDRGIAAGPALGRVLALAEEAWLARDLPLEANVVAVIADEAVARFKRDRRP